jgi:hypothetical protein
VVVVVEAPNISLNRLILLLLLLALFEAGC